MNKQPRFGDIINYDIDVITQIFSSNPNKSNIIEKYCMLR